ncbi:MAG: bifunctional alpha,alpha-trehalose-phosphate synthase (UDP-forming)/trehalose-phosphatase [Myxococcota bacterium]|nr:bifunctional alpha,alpha-trehalose-phosphate synthase (UDP-forming)/trehalose-phosphatase [Myxococcota bacterium]
MSGRLLIVSNRLPVTVRLEDGHLEVQRSPGGLATGLRGPHERSGGLWIGWSGLAEEEAAPHAEALRSALAGLNLRGVALSRDEVERYYETFCNGVLWPVLHYFVGELPLEVPEFSLYEEINRRFADAVVDAYQPGDTIWVHDYQLMLLPQLLRERLPEAKIGFFLHVPFPSSEVFRTLPPREKLLEGLLGADLIGFHTASYMRNFSAAALLLLGAGAEVDRVPWQGRRVRLGVFPMGVDASSLSQLSQEPQLLTEAEELRGPPGVKLIVGIDRLDYTKGIPRRLLAFERLLRDHPELREKVRLIQVAVPSRTNVEAYQAFRESTDGLIGRIHGAFATPRWVPIHYLFRGITEREVVALYRAADVMLVTPLRDGMNLVAKEFVAARPDGDGVLVLSEFAGAATELGEALQVNPFNVQSTADAIYRALHLPESERRARMKTLRKRVASHDIHRWASRFLQQLAESPPEDEQRSLSPSPRQEISAAVQRCVQAPRLTLLLDYDGTMMPFATLPELASPDPALLDLLRQLCERARTEVHVVSGRSRDTLESWLGHLPLGLHGEHGFWSRLPGGSEWLTPHPLPTGWREAVLDILEDYAARVPGALVEEKRTSVAWHYRLADPEYGAFQANELKVHLTATLANAPVEVLLGDKVIEVRPHGVHKGGIVTQVLAARPDSLAVALGDDRTDEDLFAALPPEGIALHVGPKPSRASLRLADVNAARGFLRGLLG